MHVLLLASAFDSLAQRVHAELRDHGHSVAVELAVPHTPLAEAVRRHRPDLVLAPVLRTVLPAEVRAARTCLVVHPGPIGDRGPDPLDRAIQEQAVRWGVSVLQAADENDAGPVWAHVDCPVPPVAKSDLYRGEIADAALSAILLAVHRFASGTHTPQPRPAGRARPALRQENRRIDWEADSTERVLRVLRAADARPGVRDELLGAEWFLHGGHPEDRLRGRPGELLATRAGAICRATADGAVWIPELRAAHAPGAPAAPRLPAALALADRLPPLREHPAPLHTDPRRRTWSDIGYREEGQTGFLSFSFPGGAMSTAQCVRLLNAYRIACTRPTSVLVLGGGRDLFSHGMHLGVIEAAADPAEESAANAAALHDLVEAVLTTTDRLVVAALGGNAAAGGAMLALAADEVWCRAGAVLNPHHRLMGLDASAYATYVLPRRAGTGVADRLTAEALPLSADAAHRLGLVDRTIPCAPQAFAAETARLAARLAALTATPARIAAKKARRDRDEAERPLSAYREAETARLREVFRDPHAPYHALRRALVRKEPPSATPPHLAHAVPGRHTAPLPYRRKDGPEGMMEAETRQDSRSVEEVYGP